MLPPLTYVVRPFVEYDDSIESAEDTPEGNEYIANLATIHGVKIEWAVYQIDEDGFHEWQSDHLTRDEATEAKSALDAHHA
jgi:hypothetical protein